MQPLLVASHIVPWSLDPKNRMNPRNGLCLNALHDRAFDRGLMTVTADFKVKISDTLEPTGKADEEPLGWLRRFDGAALILPKKFPRTRCSSPRIANAGTADERATMKLVAFHKLGENRNSPRLWRNPDVSTYLGFRGHGIFSAEDSQRRSPHTGTGRHPPCPHSDGPPVADVQSSISPPAPFSRRSLDGRK